MAADRRTRTPRTEALSPEYVICESCGQGARPGSCCPQTLECPTCGALSGESCIGNDRANLFHNARYDRADEIDATPRLMLPAAGGTS